MENTSQHERRLVQRLIDRTAADELHWTAEPRPPMTAVGTPKTRKFKAKSGNFQFELSAALFGGDPYSLSVRERGKGPEPMMTISSSLVALSASRANDLLRELYRLVDSRVESESDMVQRILDDL